MNPAWIPLAQAAMCLNCEAVFALAERCPRCAGGAMVMLGRWLQSVETAR